MSDYIKREDAIRQIVKTSAQNELDIHAIGTVIYILSEMDSADVVEVVRCKDCKHNYRRTTLNHGERDNPSCKYTNYVRDNDFYCGFGERADT